MRQAGRSLPEYRAIRGSGSILEVIKHPELAAEITLQPVRRYGVDAAILYSDIMVPIFAIGFGVDIAPGIGPVIENPFRSEADLSRLRNINPEQDIPYVLDTIKILSQELKVPLIGFAGAPFTVASYIIEGGPSRNYAKTKSLLHTNPALWNKLLSSLTDISIGFISSQIQAGAQAIQIFDSWAGTLAPSTYHDFVQPFSKKIFSFIKTQGVPSIHFGVGTGELLPLMGQAGPDVMGIDWRIPLSEARNRIGIPCALQGNLDPAICLSDPKIVKNEVENILLSAPKNGHIFNLGHGVLPETNPDILKGIVETVHIFSQKINKDKQ